MNERLKITHGVPRAEEGSCNFCTDPVTAVTVVESVDPQRHASIRFCAACFEALRSASKLPGQP